MAFVYAVLGFIALIVLHEGGHFVAAKAVGMRVERFMLFFPPILAKVRRGETEYGVGLLPFGGYVKITGMSPNEVIPPEVLPRAYYNQPAWKRIVVIVAGPLVNIVIAFVLIGALLLSHGESGNPTTRIADVAPGAPATHVLRAGDRILAADGARSYAGIRRAINAHRCSGVQRLGCRAATPVLQVRRARAVRVLEIRPRLTAEPAGGGAPRMQVGIGFALASVHPGVIKAAGDSGTALWTVTRETVSRIARIFEPQDRKQIHGIVGGYTQTEESFQAGGVQAIEELALISLSLGVINLFPFLPLDGGHIFWAVAEKVRGRRIPFVVMERAGIVGFVLILALFVVGLTNDIHALGNGGLKLR